MISPGSDPWELSVASLARFLSTHPTGHTSRQWAPRVSFSYHVTSPRLMIGTAAPHIPAVRFESAKSRRPHEIETSRSNSAASLSFAVARKSACDPSSTTSQVIKEGQRVKVIHVAYRVIDQNDWWRPIKLRQLCARKIDSANAARCPLLNVFAQRRLLCLLSCERALSLRSRAAKLGRRMNTREDRFDTGAIELEGGLHRTIKGVFSLEKFESRYASVSRFSRRRRSATFRSKELLPVHRLHIRRLRPGLPAERCVHLGGDFADRLGFNDELRDRHLSWKGNDEENSPNFA